MPKHHPTIPPAPQPTKIFFDPFQSSSTGHQTDKAILAGSTSWRDSRAFKLSHQFRDSSGSGGDTFLLDLVGAGSEGFGKDGRKPNGQWEKGAEGLRRKEGNCDIRSFMGGRRKSDEGLKTTERRVGKPEVMVEKGVKRKRDDTEGVFLGRAREERSVRPSSSSSSSRPMLQLDRSDSAPPSISNSTSNRSNTPLSTRTSSTALSSSIATITNTSYNNPEQPPSPPSASKPQIFTNLTIYLNGSTYPYISDHKLKQLIAQHGGNCSLHLARRKVTHVIVSDSASSAISPFVAASTPGLDSQPTSTSTSASGSASGSERTVKGPSGALASSKIQKENLNVHGKGVKYVTVKWVLDCIEKGKRVSEVNYVPKGLKGRFGGSVLG